MMSPGLTRTLHSQQIGAKLCDRTGRRRGNGVDDGAIRPTEERAHGLHQVLPPPMPTRSAARFLALVSLAGSAMALGCSGEDPDALSGPGSGASHRATGARAPDSGTSPVPNAAPDNG